MRSAINKSISVFLSLLLVIYAVSTPFALASSVYAQEETANVEASPAPTSEPSPSSSPESTPAPSSEPEPTSAPSTEPAPTPAPESLSSPVSTSSPIPTPVIEPTPVPSPTAPPLTSKEYDAWKEQKEIDDNAQELREDVWEDHEEDKAWVAAHGGNEYYFTSGQWQKDEDAKKKAEEEAAAKKAAEEAAKAQSIQTAGPTNSIQAEGGAAGQAQALPNCPSSAGSPASAVPSSSIALAPGDNQSTATANDHDLVAVTNNNCTGLSNDSTASGNSGTNTVNGNDGDISMVTGDAGADGRLVNQANTNITDNNKDFGGASATANSSFAQGSEAENLSNGADGENLAQSYESDTLVVDNTNTVVAENQMTLDATSGVNSVSGNDGGVQLTTGDLELIANMLNILNLNVTGDDFLHLIVNIFGQLDGDLNLDDIALALGYQGKEGLEVIARNSGGGSGQADSQGDSNNTAIAEKTENTTINNTNNATVENEMDINAASGVNEVSGNDGDVDVVTGRIQILANMMNFINSNFSGDKWSFIMVNIFGSLTGNIYVPETANYTGGSNGQVLAENIAGEDSFSESNATNLETTNVANKNGVTLDNNISASGVTGNNTQSSNDGPATTNSGEVDLSTNILNFLNMNISGNNFVFLIVNVFGKWMGQIVNFADLGTISAPDSGTFAALSTGGGSASALGSSSQSAIPGDSNNTANATLNQTTDISNTNTASVGNNININAATGENSANKNDGTTSVKTGWIEIDANLLNIINTNVSGNNWMIVFLNIFGNFNGNLSFGRPAPQAVSQTQSEQDSTTDDTSGHEAENKDNNGQANNNPSDSNNSQGSSGSSASAQGASGNSSNNSGSSSNTASSALAGSTSKSKKVSKIFKFVQKSKKTSSKIAGSKNESLWEKIINFVKNTTKNIAKKGGEFISSMSFVVYGKEVN